MIYKARASVRRLKARSRVRTYKAKAMNKSHLLYDTAVRALGLTPSGDNLKLATLGDDVLILTGT